MTSSESQKRASRRYAEKAYTRIAYAPTNAHAEKIKEYCAKRGISMRQFLNEATQSFIDQNPV